MTLICCVRGVKFAVNEAVQDAPCETGGSELFVFNDGSTETMK